MPAGARDAHEVVLTHSDGRWRARGAAFEAAHADLRALDALIVRALEGERRGGRVHVRFDICALPAWLRQYHSHYCNYVLRLPTAASRP